MNCVSTLSSIATGLVVSLAAHANEPPVQEATTLERLKRTYLVCRYTASVRRLMTSEISLCAEAAEELLEQGFNGDVNRLLSWWRAERARQRFPTEARPL